MLINSQKLLQYQKNIYCIAPEYLSVIPNRLSEVIEALGSLTKMKCITQVHLRWKVSELCL